MDKEKLWALCTVRNPHWLTEGVTWTPDMIRRIFDQTWDLGFEEGQVVGARLARAIVQATLDDTSAEDYQKTIDEIAKEFTGKPFGELR